MNELIAESLKYSNLPVTILLLLVLFYWVVNLLGLFDLDMFHGDVEINDADVHLDTDGDSLLGKTFEFGDLPIAIVISFFVLFLWMIAILTNYYLGNFLIALCSNIIHTSNHWFIYYYAPYYNTTIKVIQSS